jgi:thiol-disulfide isomerase/thioredoxin
MKKSLVFFVVVVPLFLMICHPTLAANLPPSRGGVLPPITLPVPEDPNEKEYLGLSGGGFFRIPQIKARVVIIEIFSMYCPKCQKIAPGMDDLYYLIESDLGLKNKIKLIGIGAGDSRHEVDVFKKTFNTPFPLFPDNDFTIHKALGDVRSPYFIVIKINQEGTPEVVHSELDSFNEARPFLDLIINASGLK